MLPKRRKIWCVKHKRSKRKKIFGLGNYLVQREEVEWKRKRGKIFGDGEIFGPQRGKRTERKGRNTF